MADTPVDHRCPVCWTPFTATSPRARYCSGACRVEDWRRRREASRPPAPPTTREPAPATRREYRYRPATGPGPCPEHAHCLVVRCDRFLCIRLVHVPLDRRGRPRRFCSPACRVAEHRRLRG
jgi:hypothetical protein